MSSSTNAICTFEALFSFYSLLDWSDSPHLGQQLRPELGIPPQEILNFGGAEKRDITLIIVVRCEFGVHEESCK